MIWIAILILALIVIALVFLKNTAPQGEYKAVEFLSPAEKSFLSALDSAVATKYRIFAKVRVADIISPTSGDRSSWQSRFNKINAKHIDFLLCELTTADPACAIELDDRTHLSNSRSERDNFLNHALKSAGIPLARFSVSRTYVPQDIFTQIESVKDKSLTPNTTPACPKCGKQMVMRKAQTGPNTGHSFWGCSGYPTCKGIVNIG